jgi:succinate dehydrogenase flavin-adding protein (antitoxin of CptAB toxin-antitoxin module)
MYLDEEIFNSEFNERLAKERAQNYMRLKNGYKEPQDKHVQSVINKFAERSEIGLKKYGTTLERNDLKLIDWLTNLQEELMDATLYCEKLKEIL